MLRKIFELLVRDEVGPLLVLDYTSQTHVFRNQRQYLVEQNQCNAKQVIGATAVFIVTSAQLSGNGTIGVFDWASSVTYVLTDWTFLTILYSTGTGNEST